MGAGRANRVEHGQKDQGLSPKSPRPEGCLRKGVDVKKAVADVLCRAVRLPIPSAAEIVSAWRMLVKVDLLLATRLFPKCLLPTGVLSCRVCIRV